MDIEGIYENMIQKNKLPLVEKGSCQHSDNLGQTSDVWANRKPRIIHAVLALLVLILAAALSTVTYLYLRGKIDHTMSALMWKAHFERTNASIASLTGQNEILVQKLSEMYTVYKGNLYYFSCVEKSWTEAEQFCVSHGSHLTSVTSMEEQEFLYKKGNGVWHWNGLNRRKDQKTFQWTDGTLFDEAKTKEFWIDGEPNNSNNNEQCVHFRDKELKSWNDLNCETSLKFICKWNCESSELCGALLGHRY